MGLTPDLLNPSDVDELPHRRETPRALSIRLAREKAERALEMAIKRAKSRVAFGQRISEMGVTKAHVADMRMEIDMARLLVLKAAWAMDKYGNKEARQQIAMIKVAVPNITSKVVDRCLQLHGAGGVSQVFKLASMYAHQRTLRLADGPDEVHRDQVGRLEIAKYN